MDRQPQPSSGPRSPSDRPVPARRGAVLIIGAATLLLVTLAVVAITEPQSDDHSGTGTGRSGGVTIGHVHGITADPSLAEGVVLVGAHHGLFAVDPAGHATRVGANTADVMALTEAAPRQLLASGHPGEPGQPTNLGLITSRDGGHSWEPVSLRGAADFHALEHARARTWGIEATTGGLLTSAEEHTWKTVTGPVTGQPFIDLAVDPTDPDKVLVTTAAGQLMQITATGKVHRLDGAPPLGYLDWPAAETLVGVDSAGLVRRSTDGGQDWTELGRVTGMPTALSVIDDTWYVATGDGLFRGGLTSPADAHPQVTHFFAYTG